MVRSYLALAGVMIASVGIATTNCTGTTAGAGGTGGTPTAPHEEPPAAGPSMPPNGTASVTLAISKLYLGDTDPDGTPDQTNGWKYFGYDLDGLISTATSKNLCQVRGTATPAEVYPDGIDGIDNAFGKLILPILIGLAGDPAQKINSDISAGNFTIMLEMQKLGAGANYNPITTNLFGGADLGSAPRFDGTDTWPTLPGSEVTFPNSYLTNNTWVSGGKGNVTLALSIGGFTLDLDIANAVISVVLDSAHQKGTKGVIAGVINTSQLTSQLQTVAGSFDKMLCTGTILDGVLEEVTNASDILHDGTQDPTKPCDGISIGLGFDAEVVKLGPVAPPPPPAANPCDGGGSGGGGGAGGASPDDGGNPDSGSADDGGSPDGSSSDGG